MEKILWDDLQISDENLSSASLPADFDGLLWAGVDNWLNDWEGAAQ